MELPSLCIVLLAVVGFVCNLSIFAILQAYLSRRKSSASVRPVEVVLSSLLFCLFCECLLQIASAFDVAWFIPDAVRIWVVNCFLYAVSAHLLALSVHATCSASNKLSWIVFLLMWVLALSLAVCPVFLLHRFWLLIYQLAVHFAFLIPTMVSYGYQLLKNLRVSNETTATPTEVTVRCNQLNVKIQHLCGSACLTFVFTSCIVFEVCSHQLTESGFLHHLADILLCVAFITFPPVYFFMWKRYRISNVEHNTGDSSGGFCFPELNSFTEDSKSITTEHSANRPSCSYVSRSSPDQGSEVTDDWFVKQNTMLRQKASFQNVLKQNCGASRSAAYENYAVSDDDPGSSDQDDLPEVEPKKRRFSKSREDNASRRASTFNNSIDTISSMEMEPQITNCAHDDWSIAPSQDNNSLRYCIGSVWVYGERIEKYRVKDSKRQHPLATIVSEDPAPVLTPVDIDSEKDYADEGLSVSECQNRSSISPTVISVNVCPSVQCITKGKQ